MARRSLVGSSSIEHTVEGATVDIACAWRISDYAAIGVC